MQTTALRALIAVSLIAPALACAQSMVHKSAAQTQYGPNPALPACSSMAVQDGDPNHGAAVIAIKTSGHCTVPWHWHTANERLIIISGNGRMEMKNTPAAAVHRGDFILLPAKGVHQFTSETAAEFYLLTDGPFDIHYVDPSGKEIPPDQALRHKPGM